jgi:hypothetical protein
MAMKNKGYLLVGLAVIASCTKGKSTSSITLAADPTESAYQHCSQILAKGIFYNTDATKDLAMKKYLNDSMCNKLDQYNSSDISRLKDECKKTHELIDNAASYQDFKERKQNTTVNTNFDMGLNYLGIHGDSDGSGSNSSEVDSSGNWHKEATHKKYEWCNDERSIEKQINSFKQDNCQSRQSDFSKTEYTHNFIQKVSTEIVDAWKTCITQENTGVGLFAKERDETLEINLFYNKPRFAPSELDLSWTTSKNLVSLSEKLPTKLLAGNTIELFKITDRSAAADIVIKASINSDITSFSYHVPPKMEELMCDGVKLVGKASGKVFEERSALCNDSISAKHKEKVKINTDGKTVIIDDDFSNAQTLSQFSFATTNFLWKGVVMQSPVTIDRPNKSDYNGPETYDYHASLGNNKFGCVSNPRGPADMFETVDIIGAINPMREFKFSLKEQRIDGQKYKISIVNWYDATPWQERSKQYIIDLILRCDHPTLNDIQVARHRAICRLTDMEICNEIENYILDNSFVRDTSTNEKRNKTIELTTELLPDKCPSNNFTILMYYEAQKFRAGDLELNISKIN